MTETSENHLVWTPTYDYVAQKIRAEKKLLFVIAPFIKRHALQELLHQCEDHSELQVIVRWSASDIVSGVSDLEIYEDLKARNIPLYRHSSIHLKMLVFNQNWAFHTSGNITQKGLGIGENPNIEVGAQIRLEIKDWIEIQKLLAGATLIDEALYEVARQYREANKSKTDLLPPLRLEAKEDKAFSILSLPAIQSPEKLYQIHQEPEAFRDEADLYSSFVHDIALYNIGNNLNETHFLHQLSQNFKAQSFTEAVVHFIQEKQSVRFGEMNAWITDHCSDKPTPYRWELKVTTNKLYDWLAFFYDEISWEIPGAHSQVLYWSSKN
jgi:hypothetical protein